MNEKDRKSTKGKESPVDPRISANTGYFWWKYRGDSEERSNTPEGSGTTYESRNGPHAGRRVSESQWASDCHVPPTSPPLVGMSVEGALCLSTTVC